MLFKMFSDQLIHMIRNYVHDFPHKVHRYFKQCSTIRDLCLSKFCSTFQLSLAENQLKSTEDFVFLNLKCSKAIQVELHIDSKK